MSSSGIKKLSKLRDFMKNIAKAEAYVIPHGDAHQSEYISKSDQRIRFISGFSGSYGTVVVTQDKALLWTDGRYFSQALKQLDPPESWTLMKDRIPGTPTVNEWLADNLPSRSTVAADPMLMNNSEWVALEKKLNIAGSILLPLKENLVDLVWGEEKPERILNQVVAQKIQYSGETAGDKVKRCLEEMEKNKANILVISALDEIAYLLNWRGSDIPFNPVFFAYVILYQNQVHIFIKKDRIDKEAEKQLKDEHVDYILHAYEEVRNFLQKICQEIASTNGVVWIASDTSHALHSDCKPLHTVINITPVSLMKLVKNSNEIEGMKIAHIKDAVSIVKYFSWLEDKILNKKEVVTEISGAEQLEKFRWQQENYKGPSFDTISASGVHAATIHYKPSASTDIPITAHEFYLCDCGAQFFDGTTDVTRTLHFGQPTDFEKECYTRVFKGQCNLAMAKFPALIIGNYLDTMARKSLWDVGLDYLHGTGHGVGAYLNVHEYPTMISWKPYPNDPGVQPGMFLSNEPGYYEDGNFGIRLENIEMIVKAETKYDRLNRNFLTFETVTLVPIQTRHLVTSLLTHQEVQFLNQYHQKVLNTLRPLLQGPENASALQWLEKETQPIRKED